jgi:hypothetical protein
MLRFIAVLLGGSSLSLGCSCEPPTPICSRIERIGVFFLGEVISSNDDGTGTFAQLTLERFKVIEIFKGLADGTKEVWVDPGSMTSCYSPHQTGKRYLMAGLAITAAPDVANRSVNYRGERKPLPNGFDPATSKIVHSSECLRSSLAANSEGDIAFLRAWKRGTSPTNILGQVSLSPFSEARRRLPVTDAKVTIVARTGVEWKGVTDAQGKFEFLGIPPRNYRIRFEHQDYSLSRPPEELNVPHGGCGWVESVMRATGRLRISVKNSSGQSVPDVGVDVMFEMDGKFVYLPFVTRSDSAGIVDVSGLPSGVYLIAVNRDGPSNASQPYPTTYYPRATSESDATRITLAPNEQRLDLKFFLPNPLSTRKIFVHVVDTEGKPVSGATVFSQSSASVEHTDNEGRATLEVLGNIDESMRAWKEFDTDGGKKPWLDWKRWREDSDVVPGTGDSHLEIKFREWKRNGDWKPL